jgi:hypothetical protein
MAKRSIGFPAFRMGSGMMAYHAQSTQPIYVGEEIDDIVPPPPRPSGPTGRWWYYMYTAGRNNVVYIDSFPTQNNQSFLRVGLYDISPVHTYRTGAGQAPDWTAYNYGGINYGNAGQYRLIDRRDLIYTQGVPFDYPWLYGGSGVTLMVTLDSPGISFSQPPVFDWEFFRGPLSSPYEIFDSGTILVGEGLSTGSKTINNQGIPMHIEWHVECAWIP